MDLFHARLTGDAVYSPVHDTFVLVFVVLIFILGAKIFQKRNLLKGL